MNKTNNLFFLAFFLFVGGFVIYLFKFFWLTIAIGILLAVSTANIQSKFLSITKHNKILASSLTTLCVLIAILAPLFYATIALLNHVSEFDTNYITKTINFIKTYDFKFPASLEFIEPAIKNMLSDFDVTEIANNAITFASKIAKGGINFVTDMTFIVVFYFFANLYGTELVDYAKKVLPMQIDDLGLILGEMSNTMAVVLYSMIANMMLQGFLFAIIAQIYGYDGFLFGIVFAFSCIIPVFGGGLVYVPVAIYEATQNGLFNGLVILIYSVVLISIIADSFVKPFLIKIINEKLVRKPAKINELLIFFSMIAGITSFGFWGLVLGPAIITLFLAIIKLYVLLKEREIGMFLVKD